MTLAGGGVSNTPVTETIEVSPSPMPYDLSLPEETTTIIEGSFNWVWATVALLISVIIVIILKVIYAKVARKRA